MGFHSVKGASVGRVGTREWPGLGLGLVAEIDAEEVV